MHEFRRLRDLMQEIAPDMVKGLSEDEKETLDFADIFESYVYTVDGDNVRVYDGVLGEAGDLIGGQSVSAFIRDTLDYIREETA